MTRKLGEATRKGEGLLEVGITASQWTLASRLDYGHHCHWAEQTETVTPKEPA